ncbi:MAG: phosphoribosyltransferase family protein [Bacteroidia bacterium]
MEGKKTIILTHPEIERKMQRMAWEIYENNHQAKQLILIGIANNGNHISKAIGKILSQISKINVQYGQINLEKKKGFEADVVLDCKTNIKGETVIMVDDVLNSGKTMLAAMLPILAQKPTKIQTAVLANRNHKTFPVKADIVGISLATTLQEHIWFEIEKEDKMIVFLT